ncbi:hypothetical protein E2562_034051, partial [Oryza meyeriana var. granulata]
LLAFANQWQICSRGKWGSWQSNEALATLQQQEIFPMGGVMTVIDVPSSCLMK